MAARTHRYAEPRRRSGTRATLAIICGLVAVIAVPAAVEWTRQGAGRDLLEAAWAIPIAAVAAVASLMLERKARRIASRALEQPRSSRRLLAARVFAVTGICVTLSSALAVGIYEILWWKTHH